MHMVFPVPLETEIRHEVVGPMGVFNLMQFDPLPVTVDNAQQERSCLGSSE